MAAGVEIISFGYGHGAPPAGAHIVVDVRHHFRDPHVKLELRSLTAADAEVVRAVLATPGIRSLAGAILGMIRAFLRGPSAGPVVVAIGCVGGRHRSAVLAAEVARLLKMAHVPALVTHRDMARPVISR